MRDLTLSEQVDQLFDHYRSVQEATDALYEWMQAKWQPWENMGFDDMGNFMFMNIKTKIKNNVTITIPKEGNKEPRISGKTKKGFMPDGESVQVRGNTVEDVIEKITQKYMQQMKARKVYLCDLLDETLEWKQTIQDNDENTIKQNRQAYDNYVRGSKFESIPIDKIEFSDYNEFVIKELCPRYKARSGEKITATRRRNILTVVGFIFDYAVNEKRILKRNPIRDGKLRLGKLEAKPKHKKPEEVIFTEEELKAISKQCLETYQNGRGHNHNTANLAVIFDMYTGLRVGELSALKWSDCTLTSEDPYIDIQRAENNHKEIGEVKCDAEAGRRRLPLPRPAVKLLKMIRKDSKMNSEWIFAHSDGTRVTKTQINHALYHAERKLGMELIRGMHAIRKTYGSLLQAHGYPTTMAQPLLGHTLIETTQNYYIHDMSTFKEKAQAVNEICAFGENLSTDVNKEINQNKAM